MRPFSRRLTMPNLICIYSFCCVYHLEARGADNFWHGKTAFKVVFSTRGLFAVTDRRLGASHKRHGNMLKMSLICQCTHSWSSSSTSARFVARATTGMSKRNRPRWCLSCCVSIVVTCPSFPPFSKGCDCVLLLIWGCECVWSWEK